MTANTTKSVPKCMTCREIADMIGVVPQTIRGWYKAGRFPPPLSFTKKKLLWDRAVVEQFFKDTGR